LTVKIYHLIFQENSSSTTKSWRSSRRISQRSVLRWSRRLSKMPKTTRNSTSSSRRTLSLESTKTQQTELN
jgi:hypothetical protein